MSRVAPFDPAPFDPAVVDQAVEWLVRLGAAGAADPCRDQWRQWRAAHPEHERAWQHIEAVDRRLQRGMHGLPAGAARHALDAPASAARRRALRLMSVIVLAGGGWSAYRTLPWREWSADLQTARGQQRSTVLADGTQLQLNTATAVDVQYDATQRRVRLLDGELFITTAADVQQPARPFVVQTVAGHIVPLGTRFSVRRDGDSVQVAVIEGAVELQPGGYRDRAVRVAAGQAARFSARDAEVAQPLRDETAWTQGVLVATDMRLQDFTAELARYQRGHLGCDPQIAGLRISGVFPLDDPERTLQALTEVLPVRITRLGWLWIRIIAAQG